MEPQEDHILFAPILP